MLTAEGSIQPQELGRMIDLAGKQEKLRQGKETAKSRRGGGEATQDFL